MAIHGATGFRRSDGTDVVNLFWNYYDAGNRTYTEANGNCAWNCACNGANCNCGNCDAADLGFGAVTDRRINVFHQNAVSESLRHENQDNTIGGFQWYRSNCNCNCACNCNCNCACNC